MAYGDSGSGGLSNKSVTFKGFSSRADKRNFKLYDFEVAKQDLINRLSVRKGERVENPEFGTIIYDAIFEPFTEDLKELIIQDITEVINYDPRISVETVTVDAYESGLQVDCTLTYIPYSISETMRIKFDQNNGLL